jgi:hypothetical protein
MDAALRFEAFRHSPGDDNGIWPDAYDEFEKSYVEIVELSDLVPESNTLDEPVVAVDPKVG